MCWPDSGLEGRYPKGEGKEEGEKRFLYGSIFMGNFFIFDFLGGEGFKC